MTYRREAWAWHGADVDEATHAKRLRIQLAFAEVARGCACDDGPYVSVSAADEHGRRSVTIEHDDPRCPRLLKAARHSN